MFIKVEICERYKLNCRRSEVVCWVSELVAFVVVFVLLWSMPATAHAQVPGCRVVHFNQDNGLPQNTITGIAFDKNHFLWVGTNGGLAKYSGSQMSKIAPKVLGSRIRLVWSNANGEIIVSDEKEMFLHSNGQQVNTYPVLKKGPDGALHKKLKALFGEKGKDILTNSWVMESFGYLMDISASANSDAFFLQFRYATQGYMLANKSFFFKGLTPLHHGFIGNSFIAVNDVGQMVTYLPGGQWQTIKQVSGLDVPVDISDFIQNSTWVHQSGKLYAIYNGTFFSLALQSNTVLLKPVFSGLPAIGNISATAYNEATRTLAIGTTFNGLYLVQPSIARTILASESAPFDFRKEKYDNLTSLLWTDNGELIASNGFRYGKKMEPWTQPDSIWPYYLNRDAFGRIWYKSRSSNIVLLNPDFSLFTRLPESSGRGDFVEAQPGHYWLNSHSGINRLHIKKDPQKIETTSIVQFSLKEDVRHMYRLNDAHFLLCGERWLIKYNWKTNTWVTIKQSEGVDFRGMAKSPSGNVYVNTYGKGYYLYRADSLVPLPIDSKEYLLYSHALVFDSLGYVWIPTNNGLFQAREKDLLDYANNKTTDVYFHYYDKQYGFATNEFNGGGRQSGLLAPDGNMYFASMKGLVIINPYRVQPSLPNFPLYISEVQVDGRKTDSIHNPVLRRGFTNMTIEVESPYYGHPDNLQVSYRIRGLNNTWVRLPEGRRLEISTLTGGDYVIEFRKRNGFGRNNYSYLYFPFSVQKYFYETRWFYLLVALFVIIAGYFIFKIRTARLRADKLRLQAEVERQTLALQENVVALRQKNEALEDKTQMLNTVYSVVTHDLVSPLRFLHRVAKRVKTEWKQLPETEITDELESIVQTTEQSEFFVKDLLAWIKNQHDAGAASFDWVSPNEIMESNMLLYLWAAQDKGINLQHIPPYDGTQMNIQKELVQIIVRNLIDNAIKYTNAGTVTLQAYTSNGCLQLQVSDTGKGMAPELVEQINAKNTTYLLAVRHHLGLKIIFDLLDVLGGAMHVKSAIHKGTEVHISIPLSKGV